MRLAGLFIEGFGVFQGQKLDFKPGLNLIVGPNESGKSTLLTFIQQVLFGFPDGRSREVTYPALRGGRLGGRLFLQDTDGADYIVERFAGTHGGDLVVRLPDGRAGGQVDLERLLGRTNKDVFCKVFAFGLGELQAFTTLNDQAVRSHIYSAGTGGIAVTEVERQIAQKAEGLFKPGGHNPTINQLISSIDQQGRDLRGLIQLPEEYELVLARREELRGQIDLKEGQRTALEGRLREVQRLVDAWEAWRALEEAEEILRQLEEVEDFPENGLERMGRLREKQEGLEEQAGNQYREVTSAENRLEYLQVDERLLGIGESIGALRSDRNRYEAESGELARVRQELESAEEELLEALRNLGADWDEEKLEAFEVSIPVREEIRQLQQRLEQAEHEHRDMQLKVDEVGNRVEEGLREQGGVQKALNGKGRPDGAKHQAQQEAVRRLSAVLGEYRAFLQVRGLQDKSVGSGPTVMPAWPGYALLAMGLLGGLLVGLFFVLAAGGITGLLLIAGAVLYGVARRGSTSGGGPSMAPPRNLNNQISSLEKELKEIGKILAIDAFAPGEAERAQTRIDEESRQLQEVEAQTQRLRELREQHAAREIEHVQSKEQLEGAASKIEDANRDWRNWLGECGLRETLSPEGALEVLSEAKTAREKLKNVEDLRDRVSEFQHFVQAYEQRLRECLATTEGSGRESGSVLSQADRLIEGHEEAQKAALERQKIEEHLLGHREALKGIEEQVARYAAEEQELHDHAGTSDREAFARKALVFAERQDCLRRKLQYRQNLERLVGVGEQYDNAIQRLQGGTPVQLEEEAASLGEQVGNLKTELNRYREDIGEVRRIIADLEQKEEAAALRLKQNADLEQLRLQAREWAVWTLGRALLGEARKYYERERRPGVIREAEGFFQRITEGYYTQMHAPLDQENIVVQDRNGGQRTVEMLSRGTAEQLYLSLRMGLIREFGRKAEPLPLIMDDIFVNFDPERARQAVTLLDAMVQDHQVVLLTCHPSTVELLQSCNGGAHLIELDRAAAFDGWVSQPPLPQPGKEPKEILEVVDGEGKELESQILETLRSGNLGISELEERLQVERGDIRTALESLRSRGQVEATGHARGAKWCRVG